MDEDQFYGMEREIGRNRTDPPETPITAQTSSSSSVTVVAAKNADTTGTAATTTSTSDLICTCQMPKIFENSDDEDEGDGGDYELNTNNGNKDDDLDDNYEPENLDIDLDFGEKRKRKPVLEETTNKVRYCLEDGQINSLNDQIFDDISPVLSIDGDPFESSKDYHSPPLWSSSDEDFVIQSSLSTTLIERLASMSNDQDSFGALNSFSSYGGFLKDLSMVQRQRQHRRHPKSLQSKLETLPVVDDDDHDDDHRHFHREVFPDSTTISSDEDQASRSSTSGEGDT